MMSEYRTKLMTDKLLVDSSPPTSQYIGYCSICHSGEHNNTQEFSLSQLVQLSPLPTVVPGAESYSCRIQGNYSNNS